MAELNVEYNHTTVCMIPVKKRTQERYDWMRLHSFPLVTHNNNFDSYFSVQRFSALHTNQVLSLEHFLNGVLNPIFDIYISEGLLYDPIYLYIRGESFSNLTYLYNRSEGGDVTYFYTRNEFGQQQIDFVVNLSGSDSGLETKLTFYLEQFKPAGKIYEINIY
jgi:hypothetical protein